jgi:hypothetical protein
VFIIIVQNKTFASHCLLRRPSNRLMLFSLQVGHHEVEPTTARTIIIMGSTNGIPGLSSIVTMIIDYHSI